MDSMAAVAQGLTNPRHQVTHTIPKLCETSVFNLLMVILLMHRFLTWLQVSWKLCSPQPQSVHIILYHSGQSEETIQS